MTAKLKEQKLIERIEKAKQELGAFREQRKREIGQLAYQCGIAELSNESLKAAFTALATTHTLQKSTQSQNSSAVASHATTDNL